MLTVDVGGQNVKVLASNETEPRKMPSGRSLTASTMVEGLKALTPDWTYEVVSIGYPGQVVHNMPAHEPVNLGRGWVAFDYAAALERPTKIINDAAMQAFGSYEGGRMLFIGLGTGLGTAMILEGVVEPMELGHLPYKKRLSYEDYVGRRGMKRLGKKAWRQEVLTVIDIFRAALQPEYIVLGGGNAKLMNELPPDVRLGANSNAFIGGFRLWDPHFSQ
ncbi:MAG: ROK family protein [Chloroflexi bacterium]|nr:MAG: ROK family protein [Chloroflexota bacterium]